MTIACSLGQRAYHPSLESCDIAVLGACQLPALEASGSAGDSATVVSAALAGGLFVPKAERHARSLCLYRAYLLLTSSGVRQRPPKTGWVVTRFVTHLALVVSPPTGPPR